MKFVNSLLEGSKLVALHRLQRLTVAFCGFFKRLALNTEAVHSKYFPISRSDRFVADKSLS